VKKSAQKISAKEIAGLIVVVLFFVGVAFLAQQYGDILRGIPYLEGARGVFLYIAATVLAVVAAPLSTLPLLPLAVVLWGGFLAAMLSVVGWTMGAAIAFALARQYGKPFVRKIVPLEKVHHIEKIIPKHHILSVSSCSVWLSPWTF